VCEKRFIIICFIKKNGAKTTRKASPQTKFRFLFFFFLPKIRRDTHAQEQNFEDFLSVGKETTRISSSSSFHLPVFEYNLTCGGVQGKI